MTSTSEQHSPLPSTGEPKLNDLSESGPPCEQSGDFPEELSLEQRLAASVYLNDLGITGTVEDMCVRLTVELAKARQANKDLHEMMSNEIARLRSRSEKMRDRWVMERDIVTECLEDILDLEEKVEMLEVENDFNVDALTTAQMRLDNALATVDELSPLIDWTL